MIQGLFKNKLKYFFLVSIMVILCSLVSACTDQQNGKPNPTPSKKSIDKNTESEKIEQDWNLPIAITEGDFYKVSGWLSDHQLMYITNLGQSSAVYRYDLNKGESKLLYESEVPIVNVQISPSKNFILIQTSPSTYEGKISVISIEGEELVNESFTGFEIAFEWNLYDETKILITSFNEDWTFQMVLMDIQNKKTTEVTLPQPFNKWSGREEIAFLDWDNESPSLTAPLVTKNLDKGELQTLFTDVLQFSTYRDILMTITVNELDPSNAAYSFYSRDKMLLSAFSIPQLTMFSGWLVPYYDFNLETGRFVTLKPVKSTDIDAYFEGFELMVYDIKKGTEEIILDGLKNKPVLLSPSGEYILYGNRFEKVININSKETFELVKE